MTENKEHLSTFLQRGFVYQTDGFRYLLLKETIGDKKKTLKLRCQTDEITTLHADCMKVSHQLLYLTKGKDTPLNHSVVLDFYDANSLLVQQFKDTEGKIIGFVGFADREDEKSLTDKELQAIHLLLGSLSKEIAVREYDERVVRASNTLSSIMNNMGVDIYVNSFDSHDMLYANESMSAPYGGVM